jgi:hypothetical protein
MFVAANDSPNAKLTFMDMFNNATGVADATDVQPGRNAAGEPQGWFLAQPGNTTADPDRFCDCWAALPVPVAATTAKGVAPTGFAEETADYVGAFEDESAKSNWMRGLWVDWSSN